MDPLADGLLHGDCHTDNILIEGNQLVWTDWQGAGAGNPAGEFAFPSVRATPSGTTLPQQDIIGPTQTPEVSTALKSVAPHPMDTMTLAIRIYIYV